MLCKSDADDNGKTARDPRAIAIGEADMEPSLEVIVIQFWVREVCCLWLPYEYYFCRTMAMPLKAQVVCVSIGK